MKKQNLVKVDVPRLSFSVKNPRITTILHFQKKKNQKFFYKNYVYIYVFSV